MSGNCFELIKSQSWRFVGKQSEQTNCIDTVYCNGQIIGPILKITLGDIIWLECPLNIAALWGRIDRIGLLPKAGSASSSTRQQLHVGLLALHILQILVRRRLCRFNKWVNKLSA